MNTSLNGFYSGGPRVSQTRQINDPQYLKTNTFSQQLNNKTYVYFLAQKLNNSELKYNQRFFMLTDNLSFGYASKFKLRPIPFMDSKLLYELKRDVPLEDISFPHDSDPLIMNVKYTEKESGKVMVWKVRFGNQRMCQMMLEKLLTKQKERVEEIHNPRKEGKVAGKLEVIEERGELEEKTEREREKEEKQKEKEKQKQKQRQLQRQLQKQKQDLQKSKDKSNSKLNSSQNPEQLVGSKNSFKPHPLLSSQHLSQSKIIRIQSKQKLKQSLLLKSLQPTSLNTELKIPHYKYNYEFLKEAQEVKVIPEFKEQALKLTTKIIDELCLFSSRRTWRPVETLDSGVYLYEVGGFTIKVGFNKSQVNKETKVRKYKLGGVGVVLEEWKNYDYLLQITRNKGNIRVPLACLIFYKGFVCLVKVQTPSKPIESPIKKPLQSLALQAHIDPSIFQDTDNVQITQLDPEHFQQFSTLQKQETSSHFYRSLSDIYYITEIKHFLPKDIKYLTDDLNNKVLRPELINREQYQNVLFIGEDITKFKSLYENEELHNELSTLSSASKDMNSLAKQLSDQLSSLESIPLSISDIESRFHHKGLNMRYIWLIYQSTPIAFIRKLTHTYAMIKTLSTLLNCKLQELIKQWIELSPFKNQPDEQIKQSNLVLKETVAHFLNSVLGEDYINDSIRMLSGHMVEWYGVKFVKGDVLPGFLVQELAGDSGVEIKWPSKKAKSFLWKNNILTVHDIKDIQPRAVTYSMKYTTLYQELEELVSDKQQENMLQIQNLIHLKSNGIPSHLKESYLYGPLLEYLSTYIKPPSLNPHLRASSVYGPVDNLWNTSSFSVKISQIKWLLMQNNQESAFVAINKLLNQLNRKSEDNHPIENQIYILLSHYYFQKGNLKQAEKYGLDCVRIIDSVVNPTHLKKIDIYYQLGEIYLKNKNYEETLKYLQMIKYIIEVKNKKENNEYAELLIKISKCQMELSQFEESILNVQKAIQLYEDILAEEEYETNTVECYSLLSQLYELTHSNSLMSLSEYYSKILSEIQQNENFEKLIKIILFPLLTSTQKSCSRKLIYLIQSLVETGLVERNEGESLEYLRFFVEESDLFETMKGYLEHMDEMWVYVNDEGSVRKWKGLKGKNDGDIMEFISLVAAVLGVVGKVDLVEVLGQGKVDEREEKREIMRESARGKKAVKRRYE